MNNYKGRYVRYKGGQLPRKFHNHQGGQAELKDGAIGYCYAVNGRTMHVAFKSGDKGSPPMKSPMYSTWPIAIAILPINEKCWEIEG